MSSHHLQNQTQHLMLNSFLADHCCWGLVMAWDRELDALNDNPWPHQSRNLIDQSHSKTEERRIQRAAPAGVWGDGREAGLIKQSQSGRPGAPLSHPPAPHRSWCAFGTLSISQLSILPGTPDWCILIRERVNYIGLQEPDFFTTAWGKWKD